MSEFLPEASFATAVTIGMAVGSDSDRFRKRVLATLGRGAACLRTIAETSFSVSSETPPAAAHEAARPCLPLRFGALLLQGVDDRGSKVNSGKVLHALEAAGALGVDLHDLAADDVDAHKEHAVLG
jgi:hypothetical protein